MEKPAIRRILLKAVLMGGLALLVAGVALAAPGDQGRAASPEGTVPCGSAAAPVCDGTCPVGDECVSDLPGQACRCVPGPTACGCAEVVGEASLIDRSNGTVDLGVPLVALAPVEAPAYPADQLPASLVETPAIKPGSRHIK